MQSVTNVDDNTGFRRAWNKAKLIGPKPPLHPVLTWLAANALGPKGRADSATRPASGYGQVAGGLAVGKGPHDPGPAPDRHGSPRNCDTRPSAAKAQQEFVGLFTQVHGLKRRRQALASIH